MSWKLIVTVFESSSREVHPQIESLITYWCYGDPLKTIPFRFSCNINVSGTIVHKVLILFVVIARS